MTKIVGLISQKGGVGKTTLSRALGREAASNNLRVKLADLDTQQGTAVNWLRRRLENGFKPHVSVESFKTAEQALSTKDGYDLLILDGPARTSSATYDIAKNADLVVQPTGASIDDLEPAILAFHELLKLGIPRHKLIFALCRVGTESERSECMEYIEQANFLVAKGCLFEKAAYRQAQNIGLSVTETRYQKLNKNADTLIQQLVNGMR